MRDSWKMAAAGIVLLAVACNKSGSRFEPANVGLNTTGLAVGNTSAIAVNGTRFTFRVSEAEQNSQSLNEAAAPGQSGDSDATDKVVFLYDIETQFASNLKVASSEAGNLLLVGNWLVFTIDEAAEGGNDFDGDGSADDHVLHLFNVSTGSLINTGQTVLAGTLSADLETLAFELPSGTVGWLRFNAPSAVFDSGAELIAAPVPGSDLIVGNGFVLFLDKDLIPQAIDTVSASSPVKLGGGLAAKQGSLYLADGNAIYLQVEGGAPRNGDADTTDFFPTVSNLASEILGTPSTTSLAEEADAAQFRVDGTLVAFLRKESESGAAGTDHNVDGDFSDSVLFWIESASPGVIHNTGLAGKDVRARQPWIAVTVPESAQNGAASAHTGDLNGDGDIGADRVMFLLNASSAPASITNLKFDAESPALGKSILAFNANESLQGIDLNGNDSISAGSVISQAVDLSTKAVTNMGWGADTILAGDARVFFRVGENQFGVGDRNGDGDEGDSVVGVFSLGDSAGTLTAATPLKAGLFGKFADDSLFVFLQDEGDVLEDLNNDLDKSDIVIRFLKMD